jgi:SAM-dependent methyltransferase
MDYWAQVKRTVNGQPVSEDDITLITEAVATGLALQTDGDDVLLDLGCGNGALTSRLYTRLRAAVGVDFSEPLVEVALRDFAQPGRFDYILGNVLTYLSQEQLPDRFTKVLMYGCFSYFHDAERTLSLLRSRFPSVQRVFIGNLPDLSRVGQFFREGLPSPAVLRDPESKIGTWRTSDEMRELASATGWTAHISVMPAAYYAAHYRYDVLLTPRP